MRTIHRIQNAKVHIFMCESKFPTYHLKNLTQIKEFNTNNMKEGLKT